MQAVAVFLRARWSRWCLNISRRRKWENCVCVCVREIEKERDCFCTMYIAWNNRCCEFFLNFSLGSWVWCWSESQSRFVSTLSSNKISGNRCEAATANCCCPVKIPKPTDKCHGTFNDSKSQKQFPRKNSWHHRDLRPTFTRFPHTNKFIIKDRRQLVQQSQSGFLRYCLLRSSRWIDGCRTSAAVTVCNNSISPRTAIDSAKHSASSLGYRKQKKNKIVTKQLENNKKTKGECLFRFVT